MQKKHFMIQKKLGGNKTSNFDDEIFGKSDKFLEDKSITPTQLKKISTDFNLW